MFIHIVGGDQHLWMFAQYFTQGYQLATRITGTGGIGWAVNDEQPGFVGESGRQLFGADFESLVDASRNDHRVTIGQQHHIGIRYPVWCRDNDFVIRIQQCLRQIVKALLAATGNQNLAGLIGKIVVALKLVDNGLLEFRRTIDSGVFSKAIVDGLDGRGLM